jgi:hypothetical protein
MGWPHLLKITAGILLIIAVILALFDRVAAGSLVAALFVVVALFEFLPQMESFAAFGIKAQWRKKLDEAEEILEKLNNRPKHQRNSAITCLAGALEWVVERPAKNKMLQIR